MANSNTKQSCAVLNLDHVSRTLSAWTGIPPERLTIGRAKDGNLSNSSAKLSEQIFGQEKAIQTAVRAIQRRFQLPERDGARRPIWSVIFAGPSGVGKTQLAHELASHFFGDADRNLIKIDLSEFRDEHTVARLVGSPPGYVGHGAGGQLTNALRRCPEGVLLLDEVEKAHPSILSTVVLPLIGEAVVHDMNDGRTLDVTNMIVVLTSNIGTNLQADKAAGFKKDSEPQEASNESFIRSSIRTSFPKEVLGRLDDIIVFAPLSDDSVRCIWQRELAIFEGRLARRGDQVHIEMTDSAQQVVFNGLRKPVAAEGARAIKRFFEKVVVDRSLELFGGSALNPTVLRIEATDEGGLRYAVQPCASK